MLKCTVFGFLLLGLIFTDAETKLSRRATLPGVALGIALSLVVPVNDLASRIIPGCILRNQIRDFLAPLVVGRLPDWSRGGRFVLYGAAAIYLRARGVEGMGFGDVKPMALIGAFLGTRLTVLTIFAASLAGSLFGVSTILAVWLKRIRRLRTHHSGDAGHRAWKSARLALRYYEMPFGVFLGGMALVSFAFGDRLLHWYWGRL